MSLDLLAAVRNVRVAYIGIGKNDFVNVVAIQ